MLDTTRSASPRPLRARHPLPRATLASAAFAACAALLPAPASAQDFPNLKPLTLIVPFAAGSATDNSGRILADTLSETLGQKVIVVNRPGAGAAVGLDSVAKSAPDGYTMGLASTSTYVFPAAIGDKRSYDTLKDLTVIAVPVELPQIIASSARIPPRTLKELIGYLKDHQSAFVSAGPGTAAHVVGAVLVQTAGGKGDAVHYKSSSAGLPDLIEGRVFFTVDGVSSVAGSIKEGKLIGLAMIAPRRVPLLPEVPSMVEAWPEAPEFLKQMSAHLIVVPSKTPAEIVTKLNAAINRAVADATMRDRLDKSGLFPRAPMSVDEVSVYVRGQVAEWTSTFTSTGIRDAVRATAN